MPIARALEGLRQKHYEAKVSLGSIRRPSIQGQKEKLGRGSSADLETPSRSHLTVSYHQDDEGGR